MYRKEICWNMFEVFQFDRVQEGFYIKNKMLEEDPIEDN